MARRDWKIGNSADNYLMPRTLRIWDSWVAHVISSGTVELAASLVQLQSEGGASTSDTIDTLTGGRAGNAIWVTAAPTMTITVAHGTGSDEFSLLSGSDYTLSASEYLQFVHDGTNWHEIDNSASGSFNLTVNDASTTVTNVSQIEFDDLTVADDGSGKVSISGGSAFVGARVYKNSLQSVNTFSSTAVSWDASVYDTNSMWSSGSPTILTIPSAGYYHGSGYIFLSSMNNRANLEILKNSSLIAGAEIQAGSAGRVTLVISFDEYFSASDTVSVQIKVAASLPYTIAGSSSGYETVFSLSKW